VWVHLPGTPRDTPRSRLLPRPAFSAASCPPAVRPPKSLPWPVQDCSRGRQRHVGRRGLDVWLQQNYETAPLSLSPPATGHRNELGNGKHRESISQLLLLCTRL
jgi:hypothetical protein